MTGYRSKFFRHSCTRQGCYVDSLPCWDELIECFPRKIRPTDVDGFVEINGHFLFLEEKSAGVAPDEGQRRALLRLADLPPITVVFFRPLAESTDLADMEVLVLNGGEAKGWRQCTTRQFEAWLRKWCRDADQEAAA